jgi:uroporphyrinogen-III synthase
MPNVVITRPQGRQQHLIRRLSDVNQVHHWPMQILSANVLPACAITQLYNLDGYQGVFVSSPSAAQYLVDEIEMRWVTPPESVIFVCPGAATAHVLTQLDIQAQFVKHELTSESILDLDIFSNVENQKWLIACGDQGRNTVADFLQQRQAQVDSIAFYRRQFNASSPIDTHLIDYLVITSEYNLRHASQTLVAVQASIILLVSSRRLQHIAQQQKWASIILMDNASDQGIAHAIKQIGLTDD